jgi:hypothetical protein
MKREVLALALTLLAAGPAAAQSRNCSAHASVVAQLAEKYGETRQSIGIAQGNAVIEVFASSATGTWTIIVTTPDGPTCLIAAGEAFEATPETAPEPGSPA